jgi:hypothetical protein
MYMKYISEYGIETRAFEKSTRLILLPLVHRNSKELYSTYNENHHLKKKVEKTTETFLDMYEICLYLRQWDRGGDLWNSRLVH